jgi:hypothetical protein
MIVIKQETPSAPPLRKEEENEKDTLLKRKNTTEMKGKFLNNKRFNKNEKITHK